MATAFSPMEAADRFRRLCIDIQKGNARPARRQRTGKFTHQNAAGATVTTATFPVRSTEKGSFMLVYVLSKFFV